MKSFVYILQGNVADYRESVEEANEAWKQWRQVLPFLHLPFVTVCARGLDTL